MPYGGKTSSTYMNQFIREVSQNIVFLQHEIQKLQLSLDQSNEALTTENQILVAKLEQLQKLKPNIAVITPTHFVETPPPNATISLLAGHITLPALSTLPRTYFKLGNKTILPKTLSISVLPPANQTNIVDKNLNDALLTDTTKFWHRKVTKSLGEPDSEDVEVTILLPEDIINSRQCNVIDIVPFPLGGIDITEVQYSSGSSWQPLYGFTPIAGASSVRLTFPTIEIAAIKIKLLQKTPIIDGNVKHFYLGLRSIAAYFVQYQQQANFQAIYEFPTTGSRTILSSIPYFTNGNSMSDKSSNKKTVCTYNLYTLSNANHKELISRYPATISTNRILAEGSINTDKAGLAPQLERIEISFEAL